MSAKADSKKKENNKSTAAATGNAGPAAGGGKAAKGENKQAKAAPATEAATTAKPAETSKQQSQATGGQKRNIKPDVAVRDAELEAISAEFNKIKAERDECSRKMKEAREANKGGNEEKQKIRAELNKIKEELQKVRAEKDAVFNEQKNLSSSLEAKYAEERKAKEGLGKFTTVEAIDEEIQKIEKRMTSNNFTAKEEKDMIREMDKLRLSKKSIGGVKAKAEEVSKIKEHKKELDARMTEKRAAVDEVQKRYQHVKDALLAMDEKSKEGPGAVYPALKEKHDALNVKLDELVKKRQEVYDEFKKKMKEFIEAENERRKLEQERRAAEAEKRRLEQEEQQKLLEEKRRLQEEEEMKKKPWEQEIALCDFLIGYLQRLSSKSSAASASATATSASATSAPKRSGTDFGDLKPLVRGQDDDYVNLGAEKKKSSKAPAAKPAQKEKSGVLTHTIDTLNSFALLSLIPPSTEAGIDASIEQLKEKRAYYDVLPRAPKKTAAPVEAATNGTEKKAEAVEAQSTETTAGKKSNKKTASNAPAPSVQDSALFPHLPGSKPAGDSTESKQKWGPKPSEGTANFAAEEEQQEEVVGE